ncbi:MAG: DUF6498-containing protein [Gemmatimonadota bacterium]|nr:DUF6498-containing protein [Gemmatimonadota bacterium]
MPVPIPSRLGLAALVVANLAVALLTVLRGWGYYETLLVYWLEAVVIGGYNVLRLLVVGLVGEQPFGAWLSRHVGLSPGARVLLTLVGTGFFVIQFGGFALAVGLWVIGLPSVFAPAGRSAAAHVMAGLRAAGPGVALAVAALVLSHGFSFVRNFLVGREYVRRSVPALVFWPYARMSLVMLVLAIGLGLAALQGGLASATTFAIMMVLVKTIADGITHLGERRSFASQAARTDVPLRTSAP